MAEDNVVKKTVEWHKVDASIAGLSTDVKHEISVQREAIPIVFVPGVMGTRLRRAGTDGNPRNKSENNLPNLRWDPATGFTLKNYFLASPKFRKDMLIGATFDPNYLEVDNANPVGDGWFGIMGEYHEYLKVLKENDWGPLGKIFEFPVYAFGYNWTDDNAASGTKLANRIKEIIEEAKSVVGLCEQVILVTHSMGGLVARATSKLAGAEGSILGIIHGVQPALGSPAAYWRIKAGFEGGWIKDKIAAFCLGSTGRDVTALLGNSVGPLELLPNEQYITNTGNSRWLSVTNSDGEGFHLPNGDPYSSIYEIKAVVKPEPGKGPTYNTYWGLVDPDLLTPEVMPPKVWEDRGMFSTNEPNYKDRRYLMSKKNGNDLAWNKYLKNIKVAKQFHKDLNGHFHPNTWGFYGFGLETAEFVKLIVESNWVRTENYPTQCFRGFYRDARGSSMQAVLQDPDGRGDGTVPISSAKLIKPPPDKPNHIAGSELKHQPAYEESDMQRWTICAIKALAKIRYKKEHG
jgi:hypothetical protein